MEQICAVQTEFQSFNNKIDIKEINSKYGLNVSSPETTNKVGK